MARNWPPPVLTARSNYGGYPHPWAKRSEGGSGLIIEWLVSGDDQVGKDPMKAPDETLFRTLRAVVPVQHEVIVRTGEQRQLEQHEAGAQGDGPVPAAQELAGAVGNGQL